MVYLPKSSKYKSKRTKRSSHQKKKKVDRIKTVHDVRKAVQDTAPSQGKVDLLNESLINTPSTIMSISQIPFNGDDPRQWERSSKKITLGSFRYRGLLDVGDSTNLVRLLVVRDKNMDNVAWDPQSCFFTDGNIIPRDVFAQINTRNVEVLYDNMWNIQDSTAATPAVRPSSFVLDINVPIHKTITYNSVATGQNPLPRNQHHYYFVGVSDSGILPNPSITGYSATWFKNIN